MLGNQQTNSAEPSELTTTLTESSKILMAIKEITDKFPKSVSIAENIVRLAKKLGVPPIFLAETINAESGFNPAAKNPNSSATGILQWTKRTASNLGTDVESLAEMTIEEQWPYVEAYFSAENLGAGNLKKLADNPTRLNMALSVFSPSHMGANAEDDLPSNLQDQNPTINKWSDLVERYDKVSTASDDEHYDEVPASSPVSDMILDIFSQDALDGDEYYDEVPADPDVPAAPLVVAEVPQVVVVEVGGEADPKTEDKTVAKEDYGTQMARMMGDTRSHKQMVDTRIANEADETEMNFSDGGMVDEGLDPPAGAEPVEVADNVKANLSVGEYVLPANVVRYIGLKNIIHTHKDALADIDEMARLGFIKNVDENGDSQEEEADAEDPMGLYKGGAVLNLAEGGAVEQTDLMFQKGLGYVPTASEEDNRTYIPGIGYVSNTSAPTGTFVPGIGYEKQDLSGPTLYKSPASKEYLTAGMTNEELSAFAGTLFAKAEGDPTSENQTFNIPLSEEEWSIVEQMYPGGEGTQGSTALYNPSDLLRQLQGDKRLDRTVTAASYMENKGIDPMTMTYYEGSSESGLTPGMPDAESINQVAGTFGDLAGYSPVSALMSVVGSAIKSNYNMNQTAPAMQKNDSYMSMSGPEATTPGFTGNNEDDDVGDF